MIQYKVSLKSLNTFGIDAIADSYALIQSTDDITQILEKHGEKELLILGGGSNILLTKDFNGLVLKNDIQGFRIVEESEVDVVVEAGAGMNWHQFVMRCIDFNYGRMTVYNDTHLFWSQYSSTQNKVVDEMWLIQENHGSFTK